MANMMKVLQITEPGNAQWRDEPIPELKQGEVLVKILGVTTCPHWDLHIIEGEPMFPGRPIEYPYVAGQPGHEAMGEVTVLGPGVTEFAVGDQVVAWRDAGHQRRGAYAQYTPYQADNLLKIPDRLAPERIAPLELAMCVQVSFNQLKPLDAVQGKRFGVSGLGPAGLIAIQMARAYGASEVIGFDPLPERRELALKLGANQAIDPTADTFPRDRKSDQALDSAIDCTGLKASIEFLMDCTKSVVTIFGVLRENLTYTPAHKSHGFILMGYATHNREAAIQALSLVLDEKLQLAPLVSIQLPFTRYHEGVELLRQKKAIKVLFLPWA